MIERSHVSLTNNEHLSLPKNKESLDSNIDVRKEIQYYLVKDANLFSWEETNFLKMLVHNIEARQDITTIGDSLFPRSCRTIERVSSIAYAVNKKLQLRDNQQKTNYILEYKNEDFHGYKINLTLRNNSMLIDYDSQKNKHHKYTYSIDGKEGYLSQAEFNLINFFANNPGIPLYPKQIEEFAWGTKHNTSIFRVTLQRLRNKIEDNPKSPKYVRSINHRAYILEDLYIRKEPSISEIYIGNVGIKQQTYEIWGPNEEKIILDPKEYELLSLVNNYKGNNVATETFNLMFTKGSVHTTTHRLNQKLAIVGANFTIKGHQINGYSLAYK